MRQNKTKLTIRILSAVIVVLLLFIAYFFVIQPQINKYTDEKRLEGIEYYVYQIILPQLQANGYVQIPVGNQTLILVPYIPEQSQDISAE
jgi:peptidoglycan/LPS O-acetylase OafA/YrhL